MAIHRDSSDVQQGSSWGWYLMPTVIFAAALAALLVPATGRSDVMAAQAEATEMPAHIALITPSAQPGEGEPELVPALLPQSY